MRIYCFETEDGVDWPTGTAIKAVDRRTSSPVLLYRSLDAESHAQPGRPPTTPLERRHRTRAIVDASLTQPQARPAVECFSCKEFVAIAGPDAETLAPVLQKLRTEGLFLERRPPPPPPPPPPPSACARCRKTGPLTNGLCMDCTRRPLRSTANRSRTWLALPIILALLAGAVYLWWPQSSTPQTASVPVIQFSASQRTVRKGGRVTLSWNTSGLTSPSISPGVGSVPNVGKRSVLVDHDTTFSLTGIAPGFNSPATVTILVSKPAPPPAPPDKAQDAASQPAPTQPDLPSPTPIQETLDLWVSAYRANDPQRQAALYAPHLDRFFLRENVDNNFVLSYMNSFYAGGRRFNAFSISTPDITFTDPENARATFTKHYMIQVPSGQINEANSRSELHLAHIQDAWKITFERDFK